MWVCVCNRGEKSVRVCVIEGERERVCVCNRGGESVRVCV